ncbi:MFS transporter [Enterovibrio sp. ZSDZ35]|uniref:MFS transporter n=2 Tax=Enterovibrio qingdaonensis TaxID=2899818 RepID=A0ABT5QN48_9GAMM|nr:MFS transporter [Enterovibrio sp. ZSDZ35]MDD1782409.1 MFS transporter [Enterovibrio sp. ZSDZ35]
MAMTFSVWNVLLNNFVVERAAFTGREIGILQSLREVPGFLAFTAIYLLLFIKEQRFAILSLFIMCFGVAITGWFPTEYGLYLTTILMSVGFHYFETVNQSLTLQWVDKDKSAHFMGQVLAWKGAASLVAYGTVWVMMEFLDTRYNAVYMLFGLVGLVAVVVLWSSFPSFISPHTQAKTLILRKRYWLYYGLTFLSGARRQIFIVFAGFMMVEKFGYSVGEVSLLFIINYFFNMLFASRIGAWIGRVGEKRALTVEYIGLAAVFTGYAFVENATMAGVLYVVDHLFFAMAIAIKTYFQKIADPEDIASTAGVSFTINHIAAVVIPAVMGLVWLHSPSAVFLFGTALALSSLTLARMVPLTPEAGNEVERWGSKPTEDVG